MKIILLFISLFLSTSVFAGEPKEHGAGVKDEWHKDKMVGTKNDNNIVRDSTGNIKSEIRSSTQIHAEDAAGNSGWTALPGLGDAYITENTGDNADERNTVMRENPTQSIDSRAPIILDTVPPTHNKESSIHQGAMNSVRSKKPGSKKPACSLHDSVHC